MNHIHPQISIIVPVYNAEQYLSKCINSILAQIFTDFELLLIDDGSTDNSGVICNRYAEKDNRIRVLHKNNGGVSSARNLGLEEARGEWICFVDSDDWVDNEAYQEIINSIAGKKVDLVIWGIKLVNKERLQYLTVPFSGLFNKRQDVLELFIRNDMNGLMEGIWNKLYLTRVIKDKNLRFDGNLSYLEDMKFNCNYFEYVSSIFQIDKPYYNYRKEYCGSSLSRNYPDNFLEIVRESVKQRVSLFLSYDGIFREEYHLSLENKIERAYLSLNLAMYSTNMPSRKRRERWVEFSNRNKIGAFNKGWIYTLLKTNNSFIIDAAFKLHYVLCKNAPGILILFHRIKSKMVRL